MGSVDQKIPIGARDDLYRFGSFELSETERVLRRDDKLISLPPKAFAALSVLVKAEGRVVSKAAILASVWPDTFVEEGVLTQTISVLRRSLSSQKGEESPIETISRVGYRLRLQVSVTGSASAEVPADLIDTAAEVAAGKAPPAAYSSASGSASASVLHATHLGPAAAGRQGQTSVPKTLLWTLPILLCLTAAAIFTLTHSRSSSRRSQPTLTNREAEAAPGSAVPRDPQASRLYSEGVQKLRSMDSVAAAHSLEASIALEPQFALSHAELAHAVTLLGQADRALQEAHRARDLAAHLSRIDQLRIQAICEATEHRFEAAAATYGALFALVPQDLEYARSQASLLENAGHNKEGIELLEPLIHEGLQSPLKATSELVVGQGYSNIGNDAAALKWATLAADDARSRGDLVLYERALTAEAYALTSLHQFEPGLQRAVQASALGSKLADEAGTLQAVLARAEIETDLGRLREAQVDLQLALSRAAASGLVQKQIFALDALGNNYSRLGDDENALTYFQRSAALARTFGLPEIQHHVQFDVANTEFKLGRRSEAKRALSQLLDEAISSGDKNAAQRAKQAMLDTAGG